MRSYEDFRTLNEAQFDEDRAIWLLMAPDGMCYAAFMDPNKAGRWLEMISRNEQGWTLVSVGLRKAATHVTGEGLRKLFKDGYVTIKDGWIYFTSQRHRGK
jgi:uncharacterized membrane protein